jgi:hypothetical protein
MISEYIKRYIFGKIVCRKYGISFVAKLNKSEEGSYSEYMNGKKEVTVSLLQTHFYEVFFHEVGHYLSLKRGFHTTRGFNLKYSSSFYEARGYTFNGTSVDDFLVEESRASRLSLRILGKLNLKNTNSEDVLSALLSTYIREVLRLPAPEQDKSFWKYNIADIDYALQKYMRGW